MIDVLLIQCPDFEKRILPKYMPIPCHKNTTIQVCTKLPKFMCNLIIITVRQPFHVQPRVYQVIQHNNNSDAFDLYKQLLRLIPCTQSDLWIIVCSHYV